MQTTPLPNSLEDEWAAHLTRMRAMSQDLEDTIQKIKATPGHKAQIPPLETLNCANINIIARSVCRNAGTMACSNCRLVAYCSQECQKAHWKSHKRDCKNSMLSEDWLPDWAMEGRQPTFDGHVPGEEALLQTDPTNGHTFGVTPLWGDIPAVDFLNLPNNEADSARDYSIAFLASGDLRHLIKTINELPSDFSGTLSAVISDANPIISTRNLTILLILSKMEDEILAADVALHFWYSAFMPPEYLIHITQVSTRWMVEETVGTQPDIGIRAFLSNNGKETLGLRIKKTISREEAQRECDRVKDAPSRKDLRDRYHYKLKPSHRVAFQKFRRTGLLLPFGASSHDFKLTNTSLFCRHGKWLESDFGEPLHGWDVTEVLDAGKRHGTTPEDIYGCLYFHVSEQLRLFARRLKSFKISITVYDQESCQLASVLARENSTESSSMPTHHGGFDRVFLSNVTDENHFGLRKILEAWGPLVSSSERAVVVACFRDWPLIQRDGKVKDAGEKEVAKAVEHYIALTKGKYDEVKYDESLRAKRASADLPCMLSKLDAFYDNSGPFKAYLEGRGHQDILKAGGLVLKETHSIVPHRLAIPLKAPASSVPYLNLSDEEKWYNDSALGSFTWAERFVEFGRL